MARKKSRRGRIPGNRKTGSLVIDEVIYGPFSTRDIPRIEKMAHMGMSQDQIGKVFGCCPETVGDAIDLNPTLKKAYQRGQALGIEFVTGKLFGLIRKNNVAAIIFFLKTRARWSEKFSVALSPGTYLPDETRTPEWLKEIFKDPEVMQQAQLLATTLEQKTKTSRAPSPSMEESLSGQSLEKANGEVKH